MAWLRWTVAAVCGGCIAGMIAAAATRHVGGVVAFGLVSSAAVACLLVAAVVAGEGPAAAPTDAEERARAVEARIAALVAAGAVEDDVRALAGEAIRLGRATAGRHRAVTDRVR